ncbi:MAG: TolC family protein [Bacteroidota bacterium]|nr:TolC family protein [Bacteroidota bacterium]MDP4249961.1 TolC family protein [Bacteroidota bacterium]
MNLKTIFSGLTFGLLMLISREGMGQDRVRNISLGEAIDLSIKNSKPLKAAKARADQADAALIQARQNKLPDFKISGAYLRVTQPNLDLKVKLNNSGGSGGSSPSEIKVNQAAYGIANLSLPLYSGLRIQYGIRSAEFLEKAATLDADNDQEGVVLNAIAAFSNLYKANANVRLIRENLAQSRSRDSDFNNLERNGLLARNDRLKAALQTSNIELNLVDAENNLKVATVNMNLLLGLPEHDEIIPDSNSLSQAVTLEGIDDYEQLAIQNRKDIQAQQYRKKASAVGIQSAKSDYYPSLALTGGYIAADIPNLVTITNAVTFGLGVSYNVSSLWKTNAKVAQAKARLAEAEANEDYLNDQVKLEINEAYQSYISARKKIEVSEKAIEQATENYKINKNKYDNSLVTVTDLLDANVALLQAKISLELSKADALVAYNTLLQKAGVITKSLNTK